MTQQPDFQAARNYWNGLKTRLNKESSQSKKYLTDVVNAAAKTGGGIAKKARVELEEKTQKKVINRVIV